MAVKKTTIKKEVKPIVIKEEPVAKVIAQAEPIASVIEPIADTKPIEETMPIEEKKKQKQILIGRAHV